MNRVLTALALSGMFVAAPAFAKTMHKSSSVAKSVAGDKAGETKSGDTKPADAKPADGTATDSAKPAKTKKSKKKGGETPAPAPTEGAPSK
jgi:hypothetical protein